MENATARRLGSIRALNTMKLALVVPGGVDRTGEYRVIPALLALISRLAARHELHVFALVQEARPAEWELLGARVHNIGSRLTMPRALRAIIREHRIAPFELIHSIWAGMPGFVAVTAGRSLQVPSLVHVAGGELIALPQINYGGRLKWYGRVREALVLRGAKRVTVASEPILKEVAALGRNAERIALGVDLHTWAPSMPTPRDESAQVRFVHVASLNRVKDQPTLLRALEILAARNLDFHVDIVGEDTLNGTMQALTARLGLSRRVTFHGFLTHRQTRAIVKAAHVHIVSSLHEAGPLAMLEAAVTGVPTAGTCVGHVAEWAPHAALCSPVGDPVGLAQVIEKLARDEELRLRIATTAFERATSEHADHTCARFEELYQQLVAR